MDAKAVKSTETDLPTNPDEPSPEGEGAVMGFFEHIEELRTRLFQAALGLLIGMGLAIVLTDPVLVYMKDTYGGRLLNTSPTESIVVFFRVLLLIGAVFASPYITYQLFLYVMPALTRKEKRWVFLSLPATTGLFLIGVLVTWFFLMPAYIGFLKGFEANVMEARWKADEFFGFTTSVLFWHGVAFETPLVFYVLGRMGLVTAESMTRYWRHAVVGAAMVAGFLAPTYDPLTMIIVTALMVGLYFFSVALVAVAVPGGMDRNKLSAGWRMARLIGRWLIILLVIVMLAALIVPPIVGGAAMYGLTHPTCQAGSKPADFGIKTVKEVEIPTKLGGTFQGYFLPGTNGATIIIPPTFSGDRGGMLEQASILNQHGYSVLLYDSRICAGKGAISLGYNEVDDVADALDYLKQNRDAFKFDLKRVALHGFSSAGATAIMATARFPEIRAVLAEGGYDDMNKYLGDGTTRNPLENLMAFGARIVYRVVTGQDITVLSPLDNIAKIPPRPIYLIYGSLEPSLAGARLQYQAAKEEFQSLVVKPDVELWEVPNAGHGAYLTVARAEWEQRVIAFYDRVMLN